MERTKSNYSSVREDGSNAISQIVNLWKKDVNWQRMSSLDRKVCIWFGVSVTATLFLLHTWLVVPALISTAVAATKLGGINIEE